MSSSINFVSPHQHCCAAFTCIWCVWLQIWFVFCEELRQVRTHSWLSKCTAQQYPRWADTPAPIRWTTYDSPSPEQPGYPCPQVMEEQRHMLRICLVQAVFWNVSPLWTVSKMHFARPKLEVNIPLTARTCELRPSVSLNFARRKTTASAFTFTWHRPQVTVCFMTLVCQKQMGK